MDLTGAHTAITAALLPLLLLLLLRSSGGDAQQPAGAVREYYVAAVEIGWDYIYLDDADPASEERRRLKDIPQKYIKAVYREYTDSTYTVPKPRPAWTGIQGPVIVGQAGDTVVVHFKNLASQPYSISPVGITYWKQSEGAGYDDSTAGEEKEDDAVFPGGYYKYVWDISPNDGPTASDPECLTYSYSSQVDTVRDVNSGLIGALLICKSSAFTADGQRRNPAFVLLFAVFDETKSWYGEVGERMSREKFRRSKDRKEYHTINGYVNSTLPDGMNALFMVEKCAERGSQSGLHMRNPQYDDDYSDDDLFNTISFQPKKPQMQARAFRGPLSKTWEHYIAIEEITWDYAPHLKPTDRYKKVVYVEYTDGSFTRRKNAKHTLIGPLLKGKVNDQIHITLKNMASRPFNIYPNCLIKILPLRSSKNAAEQDLRSMGVPPNGTFGYIWRLTTDDGPLNGDPECLTHLYQSTISPERDLASGLVGTLLICKSNAIDTRGALVSPDKEWSLIFAMFDENKSWYFNENMQKSGQNTTDLGSYNSNVIYSINGTMFSGRQFVICKTEVTFWHVVNVGTQSDFLSVYFTGNPFQYQGLYQSVLTLFPMTGVTIAMEAELMGEWEISAFDGSLKNQGMSIHYTVLPCDSGNDIVDHDNDDDDISDFIDDLYQPRGRRPQNRREMVQECNTSLTNNNTESENISVQNVTDDETDRSGCELKNVTSQEGEDPNAGLEGEIPQDILEEIELDGEWAASQNGTEPEKLRGRQAEGNETDVDGGGGETELEIGEPAVENKTATGAKGTAEERSEISSVYNETKEELEESNEILQNSNPLLNEKDSTVEPNPSEEMDQNYIQSKPERLRAASHGFNDTANNNTTEINMSLDYDDYSEEVNSPSDLFPTMNMNPRSGEVRFHHYYIAAEEITWNYGIRKPHQLIKPREMRRGMRKFLPEYKKVVFRAYEDETFLVPVDRGELQKHLGIMGPFIRTEVNNLLTVIFKNKASRPYSFHLHGVYDRSQGAGSAQNHGSSAPPGVPGEPVAPGEARTYNWRITKKQGPTDTEFDCKTGAYYSTVDKERDLHSGLIGPLVICKPGTLLPPGFTQPNIPEFALLFHTFDETKSWYMEESLQQHCAPPCQANTEDPWYHISNKFAAINGYVAESLPGLLIAQHQQVRWHLLNVGNDEEYHAVHFHGLPFTVHTKAEHRMGVYNLFPGVFGTVEMRPPTVGTWLVECTIGDYQLAGMRAKLLVYNPRCVLPLGMKSGRIEDSQITASDHINNWQPSLARLDQSGYYNAWMGRNNKSWLQVDLQKATLLHAVETQGVRAKLRDNYVTVFTVSYSLDQETWNIYRGNTTNPIKAKATVFHGNMDNSKVKKNLFTPPFVARYIRIHPVYYRQNPALRLELLGCDLNTYHLTLCSTELQRCDLSCHTVVLLLKVIHREGSTCDPWTEVNNCQITIFRNRSKQALGVVTQGARSMFTQMMVTEFSVTVSHDGQSWNSVLEEDTQREKIFTGNNDSEVEAFNIFDPPLFGRYLRIHPRGWINDIALRLEVLGCDTQQRH
ncbi:Coagulation factor VIII [Collichthys lucidus]|uniref:Coagulation factor VIII n=1 Tax=Collichthys lucidus TaxID=240159 RepID=A0A4U5UCQ2_COLLU|nr:Coagulation factor VIII [Collichthys lucidus]